MDVMAFMDSGILDQWEELKLYFCTQQVYELLHSMYTDPQNILYLTFWKLVLVDGEFTSKAFEGEQVDLLQLVDSWVSLITSVSSRALNPLAKGPVDGNIGPKPYLGFLHHPPEVQKQCVVFTIFLANELGRRLIDSSCHVFKLAESLQHNKSSGEITNIADLLAYPPPDIDRIVQQWCYTDWSGLVRLAMTTSGLMMLIHTECTIQYEVCTMQYLLR